MQNTLFTSAVTGDEKLRTDVIAIVQNEITVVDEHTPSPGEIQSEETIVLPEIISMTEYIRRHCEKEIVAACINQINMLRLCVMYEGKLFQNVPGSGPIDYGEEELVLTDGSTPNELRRNTIRQHGLILMKMRAVSMQSIGSIWRCWIAEPPLRWMNAGI